MNHIWGIQINLKKKTDRNIADYSSIDNLKILRNSFADGSPNA